MATISNLFGNQGPERYPVLPGPDGRAGLDVDGNGAIDDSDAFLSLVSREGDEYLEFRALREAMERRADQGPVPAAEVAAEMAPGSETSVVNGSLCFDMVSTYRQKQSFELQDGRLFYTLEPDPEAPLQKAGPVREGTMQLVEDEHGVLRRVLPEPEIPEPVPGALSEPTCVERDGVLHWLFPGEVLQEGDKVIGGPDDFAENLARR